MSRKKSCPDFRRFQDDTIVRIETEENIEEADMRFLTDELRKILSVGLIIGFMDGLAACINSYFSFSIMPGQVFQYIASGIYGVQAFSGGFSMIILGILIHFFVAIVVTGIFFLIYNNKFLRREFYLLHGALYGILVWAVMNYVVIPLSAVAPSDPGTTHIIISLMIHIFIVGIPIGLFAGKDTNYSFDSHFNQKKEQKKKAHPAI